MAWVFAVTAYELWIYFFLCCFLEKMLFLGSPQACWFCCSSRGVQGPGLAALGSLQSCPCCVLSSPSLFALPGLHRLPRISRSQRGEGHTGKSCFPTASLLPKDLWGSFLGWADAPELFPFRNCPERLIQDEQEAADSQLKAGNFPLRIF